MQQLRFYFPQWLYMFRATISPIIMSKMLYMAIIVVKSVQQNATIEFLFSAMSLHVSCDKLNHHQEYNAVYGHYCGEISPTRCNNCVFILRNGFTCFGRQSHPSSGVQCCIWPLQWLNKSNKMQQLRFYSPQWLYSTCFGWQFHPSSGVQCCIWPL